MSTQIANIPDMHATLVTIILTVFCFFFVGCGQGLNQQKSAKADLASTPVADGTSLIVSIDDTSVNLVSQKNRCVRVADSTGRDYLYLQSITDEDPRSELGFAFAFPADRVASVLNDHRDMTLPQTSDFRFSGFVLESPNLVENDVQLVNFRRFDAASEGAESLCELVLKWTGLGLQVVVSCEQIHTFALTSGPLSVEKSSRLSVDFSCSRVIDEADLPPGESVVLPN